MILISVSEQRSRMLWYCYAFLYKPSFLFKLRLVVPFHRTSYLAYPHFVYIECPSDWAMLTFAVCMTCVLLCLSSAVSLLHFLSLASTMSYYTFYFSSNLSVNNFTYTCHLLRNLSHVVLCYFFYCLHSRMLLFFRITLLAWLINGHLVQNRRSLLIHYFISFQQHSWLSISLIK